MLHITAGAFVLIFLAIVSVPQTPSTLPEARGVLRLRVRVKLGDAMKGLGRKRFFLIKGTLEQNKSVVEAIEKRPFVSRDCFYARAGASAALIKWLQVSDCESVYCREIQPDDIDGPAAIPEFANAAALGEKEFGSRELARKWLAVNLAENLRHGFYQQRRTDLNVSIKQAEAVSGAPVLSVMTDRNGTAYFTDLQPGTYTLSNIVPTEIGSVSVSWNCEVQVKPGDLATEKPYLISNRTDRNVKCVAVEKPLPVCESGK
jgi:hypothetical protein